MVIPDTVQAVLAARIDRLLPAEKRLLQTASVIGQEVSLPLLRAIAALPEEVLQQSLQALQHSEFLYETHAVPEPVYTFKHALTQEVAYQSLLMSTRRQYHQRIARALERAISGDRRVPARTSGLSLCRGGQPRTSRALLAARRSARHRALGQSGGDRASDQRAGRRQDTLAYFPGAPSKNWAS